METHLFGSLPEQASFTEVLASTDEVPAAPRFIFGTMRADVASTYFSRSRLAPAGVYRARDICVAEGFILSAGNRILIAPQLNIQRSHVEQALTEFGSPPSQIESSPMAGTHVLITGPGYKIYGHWLADMLPRLAILASAGVDLDRIRLLVPHDIPHFAVEMLELLGFGRDQLVFFGGNAGSLLIEELLLPSFLHNGVRYSRLLGMASALLRDRVAARHGSLSGWDYPARILVARVGRGQRALVNRDAIETECVAAGFSRVQPELMPLLEQWRLFAAAREIVGEYGSALHASLFSQPGTVICGLRGSMFHPAFIQSGFGDVLEQPTGYIFGETLDRESGHFRLRVGDVVDCLSSIFGQATLGIVRSPASTGAFDSSSTFLAAVSPPRLESTETLTVDFSCNGNSAQYRLGGWSAQEENHVWSLGEASVLALPRADAVCDWVAELDIGTCLVPPTRTSQSLQVEVNGHCVGNFLLAKRETVRFRIPRKSLNDSGDLHLRFVHPDAISPKSAGASSDDRELAISFHKLTISSAQSNEDEAQ